jgi:hypothetical protein
MLVDDSELVIACHCRSHPDLYIEEKDKIRPLGPNVSYVDTKCPDDTWNKIENESKMYVWGHNCPVYNVFRSNDHRDKILVQILTESDRILKKGGLVIFRSSFELSDEIYNFLKQKPIVKDKYDLTMIDTANFKFFISKIKKIGSQLVETPDSNKDNYNQMFIFTKKCSSGGSKEKNNKKNYRYSKKRSVNRLRTVKKYKK